MGEGAHDTVAGEEVPGLFDGFLTAILEISPFQSIDAPFFLIEILPVNPLEKQEKVHCLLLFPVLHVQPVFPVQERELAVPKCDIPKRRAAVNDVIPVQGGQGSTGLFQNFFFLFFPSFRSKNILQGRSPSRVTM